MEGLYLGCLIYNGWYSLAFALYCQCSQSVSSSYIVKDESILNFDIPFWKENWKKKKPIKSEKARWKEWS